MFPALLYNTGKIYSIEWKLNEGKGGLGPLPPDSPGLGRPSFVPLGSTLSRSLLFGASCLTDAAQLHPAGSRLEQGPAGPGELFWGRGEWSKAGYEALNRGAHFQWLG